MAVLYTASFITVILFFKLPNLKILPLKYYIFGLGSAVTCSISFAVSLANSVSGTQAMEVGMVNYLWPALTIFFAVLFNGQKAKWWLFIGVVLALYGVCMVLSGQLIVDFVEIYHHVLTNPFSYFLGLIAAVSWAAYSNFTRAWAKGQNPTCLVFGLDVILFNFLWLSGVLPSLSFNWSGATLAVLGAVMMGGAYGLWTFGVQKGRIAILSIASYFTPVLSCVFASFLIGAQLNHAFWAGVAIVVSGSFICWLATR